MNRAAGWLGGVGGRRRGPGIRGSCVSGCRCWGGFEYNSSCGWKGSRKAKPQARKNEHRKFCRSFMPSGSTKHVQLSRGRFRVLLFGRDGTRPYHRFQREATELRSVCAEQSRRDGRSEERRVGK